MCEAWLRWAQRAAIIHRARWGQRLRDTAVVDRFFILPSRPAASGNPSVHRDIQPGNCIINNERGLVLIDIRTLRLVDHGFDPAGLHTPEYTAPEVLAAPYLPRTAATDVYSLGAVACRDAGGEDPGTALADGGTLLDVVTLHRAEGLGPDGCEGDLASPGSVWATWAGPASTTPVRKDTHRTLRWYVMRIDFEHNTGRLP